MLHMVYIYLICVEYICNVSRTAVDVTCFHAKIDDLLATMCHMYIKKSLTWAAEMQRNPSSPGDPGRRRCSWDEGSDRSNSKRAPIRP